MRLDILTIRDCGREKRAIPGAEDEHQPLGLPATGRQGHDAAGGANVCDCPSPPLQEWVTPRPHILERVAPETRPDSPDTRNSRSPPGDTVARASVLVQNSWDRHNAWGNL